MTLKQGEHSLYSYASVAGFLTKLAITSVGIPVGLVLDYVVKYDGILGSEQLPETWVKMRICATIIPIIFWVLALLFIVKFPLSKAQMKEIRTTLNVRKAQLASDV